MANAQDLYRQGIIAIREEGDFPKGQNLLRQSLKADPANDLGWLWLARTLDDPTKRLQCVERALNVNPNNRTAQVLQEELTLYIEQRNPHALMMAGGSATNKSKIKGDPLTPDEQRAIKEYLDAAQKAVEAEDIEGAVEQWVNVLYIQADHEVALPQSIRHLTKLEFFGDAMELAWRALESGSKDDLAPVLLRLSNRIDDHGELERTYDRFAHLPNINEGVIGQIADDLLQRRGAQRTFDFVSLAAQSHPQSQKILLRLAGLYELGGNYNAALAIYKRIVAIDYKTEEGKLADTKVLKVAPTMFDRERASVMLALREVLGIFLVYLLLAWQDAGLSLTKLGVLRVIGLSLTFVGGYLVVSGTSGAHQQFLAKLFRGQPDENTETGLLVIPSAMRDVMLGIGGLILAVAFYLVFHQAIELLFNPVPPDLMTIDEMLEGI